jgi:hypothetical protein
MAARLNPENISADLVRTRRCRNSNPRNVNDVCGCCPRRRPRSGSCPGCRFQPGLCYPGRQRARDPLTRGQFHVRTDGTKFIKTARPMCQCYHPAAPLTEEEVIARARTDC